MNRINVMLAAACVLSTAFIPGCRPDACRRKAEVMEAAEKGEEGFPALKKALEDEDFIVRRTAARGFALAGREAAEFLRGAVAHDDPQVGRIALLGLESSGEITAGDIASAMNSADDQLRLEAVRIMLRTQPLTADLEKLMERAARDASPIVRAELFTARWTGETPEEAEKFDSGMFTPPSAESFREKHWDKQIKTLQSFRLPAEGWKFRLDPAETGHAAGWHLPGYSPEGWDTAAIENFWQESGYEYVGAAWYRGRFEMPQAVECDGVEIHFGAVDSNAWVWINGEYAGEHRGPWDAAFSLDITELVNWGTENQITVRAKSTGGLGGIWQPVAVNILALE